MADKLTTGPLLTLKQLVQEIAKGFPETSITEKSLRRFLQEGLPHVHIGGTIYLQRDWYDDWILEQKTTEFKARKRAGADA